MPDGDDFDAYVGTGEVLGVIELGFGLIVIRDDGDPDHHTEAVFVAPNDAEGAVTDGFRWARRERPDTEIAAALDSLSVDAPGESDGTGWNHPPAAFACDVCHQTWPGPANQTPDADADHCPDCYDGDGSHD